MGLCEKCVSFMSLCLYTCVCVLCLCVLVYMMCLSLHVLYLLCICIRACDNVSMLVYVVYLHVCKSDAYVYLCDVRDCVSLCVMLCLWVFFVAHLFVECLCIHDCVPQHVIVVSAWISVAYVSVYSELYFICGMCGSL